MVRQGLTDLQSASAGAVTALKKVGAPKLKKKDAGAKLQREAVAAFEESNRVATEGLAGLDRGDLTGQTGAARALIGARQAPTEFHGTVLRGALVKDKKLEKAVAKECV